MYDLRNSLRTIIQKYTGSQQSQQRVQVTLFETQEKMKLDISRLTEESCASRAKTKEWEDRYHDLASAHYQSGVASNKSSMPLSKSAERERHCDNNATPPMPTGYWPNTHAAMPG